MTIRKNLLLAVLLLPALCIQAQVTVDNSMTVTDLVNNVLLGEGVQATNITYNGMSGDSSYIQLGTFVMNDPATVFPIDSGVVMASSYLNIVNEGGTNNNTTDPGFPNFHDADLDSVAGYLINNAAVLEFDFTVEADSVKFDYIFSSAEYPDFTCSSYNDVFGFFLSGPGINGPYQNNATNIALIPNSTYPVAINTVNSGPPNNSLCAEANPNYEADSQYFVPNDPPDPTSIQIKGHTVSLPAYGEIQCGSTYHIKLAIGNATDQYLQSAVFLKAGSFTATGNVFVDVSPTIGGAAVTSSDYDSVLVAGCSEAHVQLTRPSGLPVDSVFSKFGGTAVQGEDYVLGENDTLFFFPEGVDTLNFTITTLYDGVPGEGETLDITIFYFNGCGELDSAWTSIPFVDPYHISTETEDVELFCPADSVFIEAQGVDGIEPYKYDWGDAGVGQTVHVGVPPDQQYYDVFVTDACGFDTIPDSVLVINSIPPPLTTGIDPFDQPECTNQPVALYSTTTGGNGEYTYTWEDAVGNTYPHDSGIGVENINQVITFDPEPVNYVSNLPVYLTVRDTCGTTVQDTVEIDYPFFDPITASYNPLLDNCPEDPVELRAQTQNGAGDVTYQWAITQGDGSYAEGYGNDTRETFVVPAGGVNEYTLVARDKCGRANFDYQYLTGDNQLAFAGMADYSDSVRVIKLDHIMNVMTPNRDGKNDFFVVEGIDKFDDAQVQIYDRWGKVIYETKNYKAGSPLIQPDDSFDGGDFDEGTYYYVINIDHGECVQSGQVEILRGNTN